MDRITIATAYAIEAPVTLGHDPDGMPIAKHNGWQVEAMTERGDVYRADRWYAYRADADNWAAVVTEAGDINPLLWTYDRPAYGSQAYLEDGGNEADMAFEAEAEEWGPPAYAL